MGSTITARRAFIVLAILVALPLLIRLYYAFQNEGFTGSDAYFSLREARSILETGLPAYHDPYSYGGKEQVFMPLFYYLLAFIGLFMPLAIAGKTLPNILSASIAVISYLIAYQLTKNRIAALFSAGISGLIPAFISSTTNTLSPLSLSIPLLFLIVYCFIRIHESNFIYWFLTALLASMLTTPLTAILIPCFFFYSMLLRLEDVIHDRAEIETMIFSLFFIMWALFLVFKDAFAMHGAGIMWNGTVAIALTLPLTLPLMLYLTGLLPAAYGIYSIFDHIFKRKDRRSYPIMALALSAVLLAWLRIIEVTAALAVAGISFAIIFSLFYNELYSYIEKTNFARLKTPLMVILGLVCVLSLAIPSWMIARESSNAALSDQEYTALSWIRENTEKDSVILATVEEGNAISAVAERKNVADDNALLQADVAQRAEDISRIFSTQFKTESLRLLTRYNVTHVMITSKAKEQFGSGLAQSFNDEECFKERYKKDIRIYEVKCRFA